MPGVFLSHNTADKGFSWKLGKSLQEYGIQVWIDEAEIKVGESLIRKISEGIEEMEYLAVILTPSSVSSGWVQKELELAITSEITGKQLKVLPVLYKDCDIPFFLRDKLYVDFRGDFDSGFQKILNVFIPNGLFDEILETVKSGLTEELNSYKRLPNIDLNGIDKYFSLDGSARQRVANVLNKCKERGWLISNEGNPSTFELLEAKVDKLSGDRAYVSTIEYWYLRWFYPQEKKYKYIYNVKNRQDYVLSRVSSGGWKIDVNAYPETEAVGEPIQKLLGEPNKPNPAYAVNRTADLQLYCHKIDIAN